MKNKKLIIGSLIIVALCASGVIAWQRSWNTKFKAPSSDWYSDKQVEDYFIEKLKMPDDLAIQAANLGIEFRVSNNTTLESILGNLTYYGLARDKTTLKYALEHSTDTVLGKDGAITAGSNTIDTNASYYLTNHMTAWELADILLNKPHYWDFDEYSYLFMPHKPE